MSTPTTAPRSLARTHRGLILTLLSTGQLMVVLDFSIVNVALPTMQRQFHLSAADLQWVVSAYALTFGGFLLLGGRLSDFVNRKAIFMAGLALFGLASLAGGLAPALPVILATRAAQGLGAALLAPTALALATTTFAEGPERNRALGIIGSVTGIGFAAGALLGGLLTGYLSWRWVFFVNTPISALALLSAAPLLPATAVSGSTIRRAWDGGGAVLGTAGLAILVLALTRLAAPDGCAGPALALGVLAVTFVIGFVTIERRARNPLVPLDIFRLRSLTVANLVVFLIIADAASLAFILTLYLQGVLNLSPLATGLAFLPSGASGVGGGLLASRAVTRLGMRGALVLGPLLVAVGCLLLIYGAAAGMLVVVVVGNVIGGSGIGWTNVTTMIAGTAGLGPARQGLAAGLLTTAQQIGAAVGVSLASVVATIMPQPLGVGGHHAATAGEGAALVLALALAVAAGLLAGAPLRLTRSGAPRVAVPDREITSAGRSSRRRP